MSSAIPRILPALLLLMFFVLKSDGQSPEWCVANPQSSDAVLQKALDWACGQGGADCKNIQPNQPCYLPNTVKDHTSYALNNYYQKFKHQGGTCKFDGTGVIVTTDPSHGDCKFEYVP